MDKDKAIRSAKLTAAGRDNHSENIADYVADLLRQGRAKEITDDLMAQDDPQRLHHHYTSGNTGMDMPMDKASRMARAEQMGMGNKSYHGTRRDFPHVDLDAPKATDNGWFGKAFYSSPDPTLASGYAKNGEGASVMPLRVAMNEPWDTTHQSYSQEYVDRLRHDTGADTIVRKDRESDPMDRAREIASYDPTNIRSEFARFDPRLDHLSHLSASTGGVMELARAVTAKQRAGGQIAPSKYMPGVPRAVHADGGKVKFIKGNHREVPSVVYHSTRSDFKEFRPLSHFGTQKAAHDRQSDNIMNNGEHIIPVHLSMKNPIDVGKETGWRNDWEMLAQVSNKMKQMSLKKNGDRYAQASELMDRVVNHPQRDEHSDELKDYASKIIQYAGHDGIIYTNVAEDPGSRSFASLNSGQVKSAIGNQGTFDPNDPDITKATGGRAYAAGGYVPQATLQQQPELAVARVAQPAQPESSPFLDGLTQLMKISQKKPDETASPVDDFGATVPPSTTEAGTTAPPDGFYAPFKSDLDRLISDAPGGVEVYSGYRTPQRQKELWDEYAAKYPDPEVRDNHVARPGHSSHNYGLAADLRFASPEVQQWVHDNAARYNLQFRMDHEGWHIEPVNVWELRNQLGPIASYADGGKVGDNENFQSWFGNSVTHTDGEPHVFYTGTSKDKDFNSFNVGRHGAWFTRDPEVASQYADENDSQGYKQDGWNYIKTNTASRVIPAYIKAENPYTGELPQEVMSGNYKASQSAWFDTLRAKGHDAWIPASSNGNLVVALREPHQIKSIYNNGKFDPKQKHMNKADGGPTIGDGVMPQQNGEIGNETSPLNPASRPQAGGFPVTGGIRGSAGALQAPYEASLEGLPTKVSIPMTGGSVSAGHDPRIRQIARDYMASTGMPYNPPTKYAKVDPKRASRIAAAYDDMKDNSKDPLTKASYDAMIKETMAQYKAAKDAGFKAEFWNPATDDDPYKASPRMATEDVRNNHHMWVYPTYAGYGSGDPISKDDAKKNPLLQLTGETWNGIPVTVNDVFRAVHDYFGHAKEGVGFRGDGEENAWRSHASMYSPLARMAMTSETRGQNSWLNYGPHGERNRTARTEDTIFADQKIGILPHWAHHEGAEDFMLPEDVSAMAEIHKAHGRAMGGVVNKALDLTRGFTKDGKAATMSLKPKVN